jgi:drug/metabolite transporter (DMT)-like permease
MIASAGYLGRGGVDGGGTVEAVAEADGAPLAGAVARDADADGRESLAGVGLVLLSGLGYGAVVVLARVAYESGSNVPTSLAVRFGLAGALLWLILALRRQVQRLPARRIAALWLMGLLFSVGAMASFKSVEYMPASLAALLFYIYPAFIALGSALWFKTRFTVSRMMVLLASLAGCALTINVQGGPVDERGIAFALLTPVFYAAYVLVGSRVTVGIGSLNAAVWVISASCVFMLAAGMSGVFGERLTTDISTRGWLALLALAFFSTFVAMTAFLAGIARIDLFRAAILSTMEPVVSVALAALLLSERLTGQQALGGAVIVGSGVALQVIARREGRFASTASN